MNVKVDVVKDVVLLTMGAGATMDEIKSTVGEQMIKGRRKIVLDLKQVFYLDSTALGGLVTTYTLVRKAGGDIKLVGISNSVESVLEITRLSSVFERYPTSEEAMKAFRGLDDPMDGA